MITKTSLDSELVSGIKNDPWFKELSATISESTPARVLLVKVSLSPVLSPWFGRYIALQGTETLDVVTPIVLTFCWAPPAVVPTPTDVLALK